MSVQVLAPFGTQLRTVIIITLALLRLCSVVAYVHTATSLTTVRQRLHAKYRATVRSEDAVNAYNNTHIATLSCNYYTNTLLQYTIVIMRESDIEART